MTAVVTSCSPIHSGEREMQNTLRDSILHLDAHLKGANMFTDDVRPIFKPQSHCKVKLIKKIKMLQHVGIAQQGRDDGIKQFSIQPLNIDLFHNCITKNMCRG